MKPSHLSKSSEGLALAEVLCCTAIVMVMIVCIAQSSDAVYRVGMKAFSRRRAAMDYNSLMSEISALPASSFAEEAVRGSVSATFLLREEISGYQFALVALRAEEAGVTCAEEVRFWRIEGRE